MQMITYQIRRISPFAASVFAALAVVSLGAPGSVRADGPAHGHHRHHDGVDLVFDGGLSVYAVSGHPDYFFHSGRFYHYYDGRWTAGVRFDGPFGTVEIGAIPAPLLSYRPVHVRHPKHHGARKGHYKHRKHH